MATKPKSKSKSAKTTKTANQGITVTEQDLDRLTELIERYEGTSVAANADALDEELGRASIVAPGQIPPDVVTMNSRVRFVDEETGEAQEVTLVYPQDADGTAGRISILAPVGSALIGLSVGQAIRWPMPNGRSRGLRIVEVLYQPEAAGHFHL